MHVFIWCPGRASITARSWCQWLIDEFSSFREQPFCWQIKTFACRDICVHTYLVRSGLNKGNYHHLFLIILCSRSALSILLSFQLCLVHHHPHDWCVLRFACEHKSYLETGPYSFHCGLNGFSKVVWTASFCGFFFLMRLHLPQPCPAYWWKGLSMVQILNHLCWRRESLPQPHLLKSASQDGQLRYPAVTTWHRLALQPF